MTTLGFVAALRDALALQAGVYGRVEEAQLALDSACPGWSIGEVMNHSLGVTAKFADFAAGVTERPHAPSGDLLRPDHRTAVRAMADRAGRAWASTDPGRICQLGFGEFPADLAAGINLFDCLAHTWDVAVVLGWAVVAPDTLWERGLAAAQGVIGAGATRDLDHYDPELPTGPGDPPDVRFLRFLGRNPLV